MQLLNIPQNKDLTYLGYATFRDQNRLFGIKRKDRRQHVYILGKSGTGKSALMFNMIIQNIANNEGVCVVDPHGELVESVLTAIPEDRLSDVVYFNPADADYHIGFNVLELEDPKYKHLVASGLMGIFTKIWANAWSARMEYILNNAILALLDTPGTTLLGIPRMLVDKDYRQKIISNLKDPVIRAFWVHEYEAWQEKFRNEAIAPIQNKVGQFLSTSVIRNIVGQKESTVNVFNLMNEGKIFLVNVSKGRIGEDNSRLLGGMIITKIQLAAMERVRIPEEDRKDFYLYVDEFQNFVTDSFASILSEARKYRLNLTVAHQYTAQLVTKESTSMRDSIFGNVGTMIVFRVGAVDAKFLEQEFLPEFTPEDIVSLPNYKIYLKLMIDGITSRPFSAKTMAPLVKSEDKEIEKKVIDYSRKLYCRTKAEVEKEINDWSGSVLDKEDGGVSGGDKFDIICSTCGEKRQVPFKPEPGRPVYCKDCVAKIKAGELKPVNVFDLQKINQKNLYRPLANLGIEFELPEDDKKIIKHKEDSKNTRFSSKENTHLKNKNFSNNSKRDYKDKKTFFGNFNKKDDFVKTKIDSKIGLKSLLNKVLSSKGDVSSLGELEIKEDRGINITQKDFVSLDNLKNEPKNAITKNDRSAPKEKMEELKNLIIYQEDKIDSDKLDHNLNNIPQKQNFNIDKEETIPIKKEDPINIPYKNTDSGINNNNNKSQNDNSKQDSDNIKEVPEDVLRRILED